MSDDKTLEDAPEQGGPDEGAPELDDREADKLRDLLRGALRQETGETPLSEEEFLRGVQKRLRDRSGGKFYSDEWSTSRAPTYTYLWTSVVMLVIVLFVYAVMASVSDEAVEVENAPAPVQLIAPKKH
jgi:hypothetical protein